MCSKSLEFRVAYRQALIDISKYLLDENKNIRDKHGDVWVCTSNFLFNKETRKLNKQLGITNINYFGNKNSNKGLIL